MRSIIVCAALCIGRCSADCTTVEGHECCSFVADDAHVEQCGLIRSEPSGGKEACGHHCLEDESCFWTYSAGGEYAGDCQLLGPCGGAASNRPDDASASAAGKMHSAGCFEWGADAEPVRSQPMPTDARATQLCHALPLSHRACSALLAPVLRLRDGCLWRLRRLHRLRCR